MKKIVFYTALITVVATLATSCSSVITATEVELKKINERSLSITEGLTGAEGLTGSERLTEIVIDTKISEYTTEFNKKDSGRAKNIELASRAINDKIVNPGEEFSFNDAVGPTTRRNGFKKAIIFIKGKKSTGYGGGVCQVSSTLHNAVLLGGFEAIEHHHHSLPVFYVDKGKDAATSYGTLDYVFKNNMLTPIKVVSYVNDNKVTVAIHRT